MSASMTATSIEQGNLMDATQGTGILPKGRLEARPQVATRRTAGGRPSSAARCRCALQPRIESDVEEPTTILGVVS
jgi:hypothetical protein